LVTIKNMKNKERTNCQIVTKGFFFFDWFRCKLLR